MFSFISVQVSVLNGFFDVLNSQNISYCILRNYDSVPHDIGNDLDVLVNEHEVGLVESVLLREMNINGFILSTRKRRLG